jgi:hypothetical protein
VSLFHSHSTNISRIANLTAEGERATGTAQSTYWSYYDTIRTQILDQSKSCKNHKTEPWSGYNPAKKLRLYVLSGWQTREDKPGQVLGRVWNIIELNYRPTTGTLAEYPDLVLTISMAEETLAKEWTVTGRESITFVWITKIVLH